MGTDYGAITGFVLMAGAGSRLRGIFPDLPKPLVPVGGIPMGIRVIRQMGDSGISRIIVNLHHDAQVIREGISREVTAGIGLVWSFEGSVLGTGGGIQHARSLYSGSDILVVATCDILTGFNLSEGIRRHERSGAQISLVLSPEGPESEAGRIALTSDGGVAFPLGAPGQFPPGSIPQYFPGIHFLNPPVLEHLGQDIAPPFSIVDLYREYLAEGGFIRADVTRAPWLDLGTEDGYRHHGAFLEGLRQGGVKQEQ